MDQTSAVVPLAVTVSAEATASAVAAIVSVAEEDAATGKGDVGSLYGPKSNPKFTDGYVCVLRGRA